MKYPSILILCITALTVRIINSSLIYTTNTLQYPNLTPYALRYSYLDAQSSFLIPYTYTTSDNIVREFIVKHHHPDHHGTDDDWKPPAQSQSPNADINKPENNADDKSSEIQQPVLNAEAINIPKNELKFIPISALVTYTIPTPLSWPISAQFHQQDNNGQYYYGYANPISSKQEIKTIDGITRGAYNYIDANGILQTVSYISDDINGFRVAATNLPKAPLQTINIPDSPEIVKAKEEHFQAQKEALDRLNAANSSDNNKTERNENNNNDNNLNESDGTNSNSNE